MYLEWIVFKIQVAWIHNSILKNIFEKYTACVLVAPPQINAHLCERALMSLASNPPLHIVHEMRIRTHTHPNMRMFNQSKYSLNVKYVDIHTEMLFAATSLRVTHTGSGRACALRWTIAGDIINIQQCIHYIRVVFQIEHEIDFEWKPLGNYRTFRQISL